MLKLIPQYKQGNKSPDHDPTHPYHYHTSDGKKVVVTPEDWEKYKDDPTFREVRAAIEAEQAAYPQPEYSDKYNNYINNLADEIENQRGYNGGTNNSLISESYGKQLPQGYSRTERGLIIGPDGRPLVASKFKNSPKYTADFNNATLLTFNKGLGTERNINYYPINVNIPIYKQPLPVDQILNVGDEKEKAINKVRDNILYKTTVYNLLPSGEGIVTINDNEYNDGDINDHKYIKKYVEDVTGTPINFKSVNDDIYLTKEQVDAVLRKSKQQVNKEFREELERNKQYHPQTPKEIEDNNNWTQSMLDYLNSSDYYLYNDVNRPKPYKLSRKEAENKAVISVNKQGGKIKLIPKNI